MATRAWRSASTPATCSTSRTQIEGEELKFELADSGSPTVIRDLADEASLYVLMPMRV